MHAYIHPFIHPCMHACMHACTHAYMHTCIHVCTHQRIHAYLQTDRPTDRHTHRHTYIHISCDADLSTYFHVMFMSCFCSIPPHNFTNLVHLAQIREFTLLFLDIFLSTFTKYSNLKGKYRQLKDRNHTVKENLKNQAELVAKWQGHIQKERKTHEAQTELITDKFVHDSRTLFGSFLFVLHTAPRPLWLWHSCTATEGWSSQHLEAGQN